MIEIAIPYGAYWSTPCARWQGSLAHLHSLRFAAHLAKDALRRRAIDPAVFDHAVLGLTVPQRGSFYARHAASTTSARRWCGAIRKGRPAYAA